MRFAAINNKEIEKVVSKHFVDERLLVVQIPQELDNVSDIQLISQWRYVDGVFRSRLAKKPAKEMKVAFVSNFRQRCGVSEYGEKLFAEIIPLIGDYKMFVERVSNPTGSLEKLGDIDISGKVVQCWKRGESLSELVKQIKKYDPDIVLMNVEPGIFPSARFTLSFLSQLHQYRVMAIMHSIFPNHYDKLIVISAFPEIVVHLDGAKEFLLAQGLQSKVSVLPHGCNKLNKSRLWNIYQSQHTLLATGFGLKYKRFEDSIIAVSKLKTKYPDIFLTILFSETSPNNPEHISYHKELMKLIEELKVEENVAVIKGYQSDVVMDSFYRTNRIAIFPYKNSSEEHKVFGASGSARLAMSKNLPVISSSIPHFSDLPTMKADTVDEMAVAIDKLFGDIDCSLRGDRGDSDEKAYKEQLEKQEKYLIENSWKKSAERLVGLF